MKMDPFIEAEEAAGRSIKRCCELFEVSRSAYYHRSKGERSARELSDAELTAKITEVHAESKGTYGSRGCTRSLSAEECPVADGESAVSCAAPASKGGARSGGAPPRSPTPTPSGPRT